jgi:phenylalanyl-tRNA synthetase beta chain
MKISIAWVFDHIDTRSISGNWQSIDMIDLINRFNQTTAEIEHYQKIFVPVDTLRLAQVQAYDNTSCSVRDETGTVHALPMRTGIEIGAWYLITVNPTWATLADVGGSRDTILPALMMQESTAAGWKKQFEQTDYIITVDNKSITHRPDMWCHRGFAREIAALLNLPLKPLKDFLAPAEVKTYKTQSVRDETDPWFFAIQANNCSRFAVHHIDAITYAPSLLWMAHRLARVDAKAIDAIVDTTNYVMFDIGQPMHAFDADTLIDDKLLVRTAHAGEQLITLDGQKIEFTSKDLVVADGQQPVALAGIMGSLHSSVTMTTKSVMLESACFDATTIRHNAARHKIRTEASARFEKSLDPNQNIYAIKRFLALLKDSVFVQRQEAIIISLGDLAVPQSIEISHALIEQKLGVSIAPTFVVDTLRKLDFEVTQVGDVYRITIPTFRGTKDIGIKEDIVEEVGRYFGYAQIPSVLPTIQTKPTELHATTRLYAIKQFFAYSCHMRELYNYALFDESFLRSIEWQPTDTLRVLDPVSENWQRLVTSLIPHLFKSIAQNAAEHDLLRFFEFGRVWQSEIEEKKLAGIMFDKKNSIDFYDAKKSIDQLYSILRLPIAWLKIDKPHEPWFAPYQTASLVHDGKQIGMVGKVNPAFLSKITEGDAFIFELDGNFLLHGTSRVQKYQPISKFPDVLRDVSLFMPLQTQVTDILKTLERIDERIVSVTLIDFFERAEWHDKKALAFRFIIRNQHKTMTKEEVDIIWHKVLNVLEAQGGVIR